MTASVCVVNLVSCGQITFVTEYHAISYVFK